MLIFKTKFLYVSRFKESCVRDAQWVLPPTTIIQHRNRSAPIVNWATVLKWRHWNLSKMARTTTKCCTKTGLAWKEQEATRHLAINWAKMLWWDWKNDVSNCINQYFSRRLSTTTCSCRWTGLLFNRPSTTATRVQNWPPVPVRTVAKRTTRSTKCCHPRPYSVPPTPAAWCSVCWTATKIWPVYCRRRRRRSHVPRVYRLPSMHCQGKHRQHKPVRMLSWFSRFR